VIDVARRLSWPNALKTYDINDRSRSRIGERQRRTWRRQARPPLRRRRTRRGGDALAARTTEEAVHASVGSSARSRPGRARAGSQVGYFAPPAALMNASRSVTSFTSSTTSHIALTSPSQRPFVHVVHVLTSPSHNGETRVSCLAHGEPCLHIQTGIRRRGAAWLPVSGSGCDLACRSRRGTAVDS
jgi:hypothetical protein